MREPKLSPRLTDRYDASFVEDDNGIRIEFMQPTEGGAGSTEYQGLRRCALRCIHADR
ncbi:hypothetical protein GCM10025760_25610 [Microbacterium yannicii]|uniref:Uncharacterized protein n=1 Tax=Microbacterium yannicii TaxID=671622 RepID=A0ABP9MD83_9MICO|nr:hypothetical protein [Microbacterium yannicii]MCO5952941.1 hypothetical protein [Microbacterium yannicii]